MNQEKGSFLFFQVFTAILSSLPKNVEAKRTMVSICRDYYRGNATELSNIAEFEKNYRSVDAISWYTKDTFVYKLVNKALRIADADALYYFRFYIVDLSQQLKQLFGNLTLNKSWNVTNLTRKHNRT
jgi:hypothetical protein